MLKKTICIGDICDIKHGFAFKGEHFTEMPTPYYLVTPGNFSIGGGFQHGKPKFYSGDFPSEYLLAANDIIVTMTDLSKNGDTLGYSALVPKSNNHEYLHNQRIGKVINIDETRINRFYLNWLMRTEAYQQFIVNASSGSTVKHTSPNLIKSYNFYLPSLSEQQHIVDTMPC